MNEFYSKLLDKLAEDKSKRDKLIETLKALDAGYLTLGETVLDRNIAQNALLEYINDPEITKVFKSIQKLWE